MVGSDTMSIMSAAEGRQSRILVVDDEPMVLEVVTTYLERDGYQVTTASSGAEAIAAISGTRPDLVVLDVMLPEIDGFDILGPIGFSASNSGRTTMSSSPSRRASWRREFARYSGGPNHGALARCSSLAICESTASPARSLSPARWWRPLQRSLIFWCSWPAHRARSSVVHSFSSRCGTHRPTTRIPPPSPSMCVGCARSWR